MTPLGPAWRDAWRVSEAPADFARIPLVPCLLTLIALPEPVTIGLARTGIIVIDMQDGSATRTAGPPSQRYNAHLPSAQPSPNP
jgi:hypothetical protein